MAVKLSSIFITDRAVLIPLGPSIMIMGKAASGVGTVCAFVMSGSTKGTVLLPSGYNYMNFASRRNLPVYLSFERRTGNRPNECSIISICSGGKGLIGRVSFRSCGGRRGW